MSKEGNLEKFNVGGWDARMVTRFNSIPWLLTSFIMVIIFQNVVEVLGIIVQYILVDELLYFPSVLVDQEYTSSGAKFTSGWLINDGSRILPVCPTITGHDRAVTEV